VSVASLPDAWFAVPAQIAEDDDVPRPPTDPLVARALRRDEAALAELYTAHAPAILRFLTDLLGDHAAAADATQETFVRAFRRLATLRVTDRIAPWLFGIARKVSLEHARARRRRGRVLVLGYACSPTESADGHTPEVALLGHEAARVVERAMGRLSEDRRAMLLLRLDHGLAYEEIATLMGFSLAKVKVEIHRARQVLREDLASYRGGTP
jgi:RNA polymerase sigma-70 factor (ECF subfamily)